MEAAERERATGAVVVMSGFGPDSDWYRNLLAHPDARVQLGNRSIDVRAVPLTPDEAGAVMVRYAQRHPRAAPAMVRVLGLPADGSTAGYRAAGHQIPALRLEPGPVRPDRS